jgi:amino acid adenylation domain-containing protein
MRSGMRRRNAVSETDLSERIQRLSLEQRIRLEEFLLQRLRRRFDALPPRASGKPCPLSFAQQRLWFLDRLDPGKSVYNIAACTSLVGPLDVSPLERALNSVVERHEVLRSVLAVVDGIPWQKVRTAAPITLKRVDLCNVSPMSRERELRRVAAEEINAPFDLTQDPMLRACLIQLDGENHVLLLTVHHIASDGWSFGILNQELSRLYDAYARGESSPLIDPPIQYSDYCVWQREQFDEGLLKEQISYWADQLAGASPALGLPTDRPRPAAQTYRGSRRAIVLSDEIASSLVELSQHENATLFMTLLAAWMVLLHRYSDEEDIVVGVPTAGRSRVEFENLIGFFVNMLALRVDLSARPTFRQLLAQVREVALDAFAHQDLPFAKLVEELGPPRDLSRSPVFQVVFAFQNTPEVSLELPGLAVTPRSIDGSVSGFDLTLSLQQDSSGISGTLEYSTGLFDAETIERMMGHFEILLQGIVDNPDEIIGHLPMLAAPERERLLVDWNQTAVDFPAEVPVHRLFEEQVERTPDRLAIEHEDDRVSYRELNARANQAAHYLRKRGVGPEMLVGICMSRSVDLVVWLLGILKAGGTYVPLDPDHPRRRTLFILEDSEATLVLTQNEFAGEIPQEHAEIVCIDANAEIGGSEASNPPPNISGENLAYVIYTSGSTGQPKGVEISHRALANFLFSMRSSPGLTERDVLLAVTTPSFDIAALELYLPLVVGARLVIASRTATMDGVELAATLDGFGVTVMQATPATWQLLVDSGWKGRVALKMLCGGEALPRRLADRLLERGGELWNLYGPTETTIWSTISKVERESQSVSIGRPISNTQVYVLDRHRSPVPVGVIGELCIGGEGLARGYHDRPELTAERFIPDPFSGTSRGRLYRTGDQVRYRSDGTLEYVGRVDQQVKIRGFRIELGEIEAALLEDRSVDDAVVVAREDEPGEKRLVAYVVSAGDSIVETITLRSQLKQMLPSYMIPSAIVELAGLPQTPSGKVDRRALPPPEISTESRRVACRDELELRLAAIWRELLNLRNIGPDDDFFEMGGHSLLAARLFADIEKVFGKKIPLATLFEAPTIEQLSAIIRDEGWKPRWRSLVAIRNGGARPPLFLVHGAEGNVLLYRDLALRLHPDQSVFGLQYGGLSDSAQSLTRIEDMASSYIDEIRSVQPHGPYCFGGYCLGGTIALEMARQVCSRGDEVRLVVLLETYNIRALSARLSVWKRGTNKLQNVLFHLNNLRILRMRERWTFLRHKLWVEAGRFKSTLTERLRESPRVGADEDRPQLSVRKLNDQAQRDYSPCPYGGRVVLFRPKAHFPGYGDPSFGWSEIIKGGLEVCTLPVYPRGILVEPFVRLLADELSAVLSVCDAENVPIEGGTSGTVEGKVM